jgi:hypothetical protein
VVEGEDERMTTLWGTTGDKSVTLTWGNFDSTVTPLRFYDTTSAKAAVTAATTNAQLISAVSAFCTAYGFTVSIASSSGSSGSISWTAASVFADVQQDFLWMLDEISKYPPAFVLASVLDNVVFIGNGTVTGFGQFGGVAVGGTYYLCTVYNFAPEAVKGTFHHEFFHVVQATYPTDFSAIATAWNNANPSTFTYGTHPAFSGEHPIAFIEDYGRNNRTEDQATYWAAMMGSKWASVKRWVQEDTAMLVKLGMIKSLVASKNATMSGGYYDQINGFDEPTYTVQRNGVPIGTTSSTAFNDDSANPGVTYTYTIQATNVSGTSASNNVTATVPGVAPPAPVGSIALTDYQFEIGGLLLGKDTPFTVENFEGMGWDVRNSDANRPLDDGDYFGPDYVQSKSRVITLRIAESDSAAAGALRQALARAWYLDAHEITARKPLRWKLPGQTTSRINGRPRRAAFTTDQLKYGMIVATLEYQQNDPFEYDDNLASLSLALNQDALIGFTFPLTFPITFASSSGSSTALAVSNPATNLGMAATYPTMRITGPIINPRVDNQTTGQYIGFNITLIAGQWLDVDFAERTVMLNGTASRYNALRNDSTWWKLQPGANDISFTAQSPADGRTVMTLSWRNARL